jgi:Immunity protein 26
MAKVRGRGKDGDVVMIDLGNGSFGYGRVLPEPRMAFYDLKSTEPVAATEVVKSRVLFIVGVMYRAIKSDKWEVIGNVPLDESLKIEPRFFMQDILSKEFSIYYAGKITPASREECIGLERAAGWEPGHIEDRLRDHFAGVRNKWVESLKPSDA